MRQLVEPALTAERRISLVGSRVKQQTPVSQTDDPVEKGGSWPTRDEPEWPGSPIMPMDLASAEHHGDWEWDGPLRHGMRKEPTSMCAAVFSSHSPHLRFRSGLSADCSHQCGERPAGRGETRRPPAIGDGKRGGPRMPSPGRIKEEDAKPTPSTCLRNTWGGARAPSEASRPRVRGPDPGMGVTDGASCHTRTPPSAPFHTA